MPHLDLALSTTLALACALVPASRDLPDDLRAALDQVLSSAVSAGDVPGVVAVVVDRDEVLYTGVAGVMDGSGQPMRPDTIFRIASMTKPLTSLGILMLVEEGALSLDDPASGFLPDLEKREVLVGFDAGSGELTTRKPARPITIRDLLRHTSGIGYAFSSPRLREIARATSLPPQERPLLHDPGARWTYGASTVSLGRILEEVTGQSLPEFLESRITGPLGMEDTSYELAPEDHDRLVAMSRRTDAGLEFDPRPDEHEPDVRGDGGLLSTAGDYSRFVRLILGEGTVFDVKLVTAATIGEMTRDQLEGLTVVEQPTTMPDVAKPFPRGAGRDGFGLGFQVTAGQSAGGRPPGSLSWGGVANTHFWIDPTNGIGVVLCCQLLPYSDEQVLELLTRFESTLYDGLGEADP